MVTLSASLWREGDFCWEEGFGGDGGVRGTVSHCCKWWIGNVRLCCYYHKFSFIVLNSKIDNYFLGL